MTLRNCIRCGAVMFDMGKICRACREREEEDFRLVTEFLRKTPGSSIREIHEATGVKESVIMSFIRRGSLVADGMTLNCSACGREYPGSKSLMCPECQARVEKGLDRAAADGQRKRPEKPAKSPKRPGGRDDGAFSTLRKTKI